MKPQLFLKYYSVSEAKHHKIQIQRADFVGGSWVDVGTTRLPKPPKGKGLFLKCTCTANNWIDDAVCTVGFECGNCGEVVEVVKVEESTM